MDINKDTIQDELTILLVRVFQLPEVKKVVIKEIEIFSADEKDKIKKSVKDCYHDILSDVDLGIHVTLHPDDIGSGQGYYSNTERLGLTRENYLGLAFSNNGDLYQLFRVVMKNGIRFDIGFYITEDTLAPIYYIPKEIKEEIKDEGKYWPRWDLRKSDSFWFTEILALGKLMRGDYLIADHLANMQLNETLVAQMLERDDYYGTNIHRYGHQEEIDYRRDTIQGLAFKERDESYNTIAYKIYAAAVSYDRLIKRSNISYEEKRNIFFDIWKQYEYSGTY